MIVNISVPAEVEQALDARSSMGVLGDLGAFQAYQLGVSMPVAAENPAGGMGMGMAQRFDPNRSGAVGPAGPTSPPPPPVLWHIVENGQAVGPFGPDPLAQAIRAGRVGPDTLVWSTGMAEWVAARLAPPVAVLLASAPPPLPPEA